MRPSIELLPLTRLLYSKVKEDTPKSNVQDMSVIRTVTFHTWAKMTGICVDASHIISSNKRLKTDNTMLPFDREKARL